MKIILLSTFLICFNTMNAQDKFVTSFENNNNVTATYQESISFYKALAETYDILKISEFGNTDAGLPLHELVISTKNDFEPREDKLTLFINNAIHPGEPCGVDATMMLVRDICQNQTLQALISDYTIVIVPFYNIGGTLNRNSHSRANQCGPESYGFRGNTRNYDLNRDFIKCDTENAKSFNQLFVKWNPEVMIDNHTSNGADYQYTMTLIATQKDKLPDTISKFMTGEMLPYLYQDMKSKNWEMIPYVYSRGTPDNGIYGFLDLARYSSGYAALHNTISFMPETHMLKPYGDRVLSTYEFMHSMMQFLKTSAQSLVQIKAEAERNLRKIEKLDINWTVDESKKEKILFKGYTAKYKESKITGIDRLWYDREEPYEKEIDFFNSYKPSISVKVPKAYLIPGAYQNVIDRLMWNGVSVERIASNKNLEVEMYYIGDFETVKSPYEGHYLHSNVKLIKDSGSYLTADYDFIVYTDQEKINYIISVLEPQGPDSFFAWNFFDSILMQKEHYSPYVFEDLAEEILEKNPELQEKFNTKKEKDQGFSKDERAQLDFIYIHSKHYEKTHKRYPVFRVLE